MQSHLIDVKKTTLVITVFKLHSHLIFTFDSAFHLTHTMEIVKHLSEVLVDKFKSWIFKKFFHFFSMSRLNKEKHLMFLNTSKDIKMEAKSKRKLNEKR